MPGRVRTAGMLPLTADLALAAGLFVLGVLEAVSGFRDGGVGMPLSGPLAAGVLVAAGLALPLARRRRRPLWALAVVAVALGSQAVFLSPSAPFAVGLVPLLLLTFDAARQGGWRAVAGPGISAGAVAVTSAAVPVMQAPGEILFSAAVIGGGWLAGRYAGGRQRRADQMTSYAALLEREQDRLAAEALAGERARIARELHDIIAHSVSVMGVQAGAARLSMDTEPDRARQVLLSIEETAREAVGELRRLLGVLRAAGQPPGLMVRGGFRMIIDSAPGLQVVGEAADGTEAVTLARQLDPDIVLMDIRMPGVDGIEATRRLMRAGARARVLMLTTFDLDEHVYDSFRAGASGFLLKNAPPEQLAAAIRTVAAGDALLAPQITRRIIEQYVSWPRTGDPVQGPFRDLSERELDVLRLIARGLSNAEIAGTLYISQGTVKTHVTRILAKLALRDRVQAAVLAYETGLIRPGAADSPSSHQPG